jgi:hypothetical protein
MADPAPSDALQARGAHSGEPLGPNVVAASVSAPDLLSGPGPTHHVPAYAYGAAWSPAQRAAFRFTFCLAVLLYFPFPFPLQLLPFTDPVNEWIDQRHTKASIWLTERLFHPPPEELPEQTGSGDTLWSYVQMGANLAIALVAAAAWTALDRRRVQYRMLAAWLGLFVRWALFCTMAFYGFSKVFPLQMPWDAGRLVQPLGEFSPMGLVWTFMGASMPYEMLAGWAEVIGGLLLVWRRTAGIGALLLLGVVGNVAAINYCYDVPVKLYSTQLWLTAACIAAPDARRLFRLLVLQRPTVPAPPPPPLVPWERVLRRRWLGPALIVTLAGWQIFSDVRGALETRERFAERAAKAPLVGVYQVESFTPSPSAAPDSFLAAPAWARISGSAFYLGILRADGSYITARASAEPDGTVKLDRPRLKQSATVRLERPDAEHVRLSGEGFEVKLKAIPTSSFMLLRGYHWVQPQPVNR